ARRWGTRPGPGPGGPASPARASRPAPAWRCTWWPGWTVRPPPTRCGAASSTSPAVADRRAAGLPPGGPGPRPTGGRAPRSGPLLAAAAALLLAAACAGAAGPPAPPEGEADRIVGTAAPDFFDAFDGAERAELDRIPVIDQGQGNREAVVAAGPDLVMGVHMFQFGAFDGTPTVAELSGAGIDVLVSC